MQEYNKVVRELQWIHFSNWYLHYPETFICLFSDDPLYYLDDGCSREGDVCLSILFDSINVFGGNYRVVTREQYVHGGFDMKLFTVMIPDGRFVEDVVREHQLVMSHVFAEEEEEEVDDRVKTLADIMGIVFDIKDKISDNEYLTLMNKLGSLRN